MNLPTPLPEDKWCVVKKCCAVCEYGELECGGITCCNNENEFHEYDDLCDKFVIDAYLRRD